MMEEEPVNVIRETTRNLLIKNRRFHRDEESDLRRRVDNIRITPETIVEIANKLKTKTSVSVLDLQMLQNGLDENPKNIETVLNTHGALRGLVREVSGHEVEKQCLAAGCLCNLALGDARASYTVAKAAGPYVIAALDSLNPNLAITCAYACGNMGGGHARAAALLTSQGALASLRRALRPRGAPRARAAALHAAAQLAHRLRDELGTDHLSKLLEELSHLEFDLTSAQLLFILSCHKDFTTTILTEAYLNKILSTVPLCLEQHLNVCLMKSTRNTKVCMFVYLIRTLANCSVDSDVYNLFLNCFSVCVSGLRRVLERDSSAKESLLWLMGNLFNYSSESDFFQRLFV